MTLTLSLTPTFLKVAGEAEGVWQSHVESLQQENIQKIDRLNADLNTTRTDAKNLRAENAVLKDSTLIGEKQREIEAIQEEHKETLNLLREMSSRLEDALSERDQLAERLSEDEKFIEERTADKVIAEREKLRTLELKLEGLVARTSEDMAKYRELEIEKNSLSNEVDDLTNWKAVYESGHGLQELARNQRSLKGECMISSYCPLHLHCVQLFLCMFS
jgi:chromosome segregation ATPase